MTKAEALQVAARTQAPVVPVRGARAGDLAEERQCGPTRLSLEAVDTSQGKALHVVVPALSGWDTYGCEFAEAFAEGHSITCFRAKGGPNTRRLIAEWQETDGSRWIATFDVTPEWRQYALPPEAFLAWEPSSGRGGPKDRLNVRNATRFTIGVAISHMPDASGRQEYWFDDLGTAPCPWDAEAADENIPHIESLSPAYQFFPIATPAAVSRPLGPYPDSQLRIDTPQQLSGIHPRPGVAGYAKDRPWIRQVLLYAHQDGDFRGAIATLTIPTRKSDPAGAIVALTPREPAFYQQRSIAALITDVAQRRLRRGIFLQEGGAAYYTALENQNIPVAARRCGDCDRRRLPPRPSACTSFPPRGPRPRTTVRGRWVSGRISKKCRTRSNRHRSPQTGSGSLPNCTKTGRSSSGVSTRSTSGNRRITRNSSGFTAVSSSWTAGDGSRTA